MLISLLLLPIAERKSAPSPPSAASTRPSSSPNKKNQSMGTDFGSERDDDSSSDSWFHKATPRMEDPGGPVIVDLSAENMSDS